LYRLLQQRQSETQIGKGPKMKKILKQLLLVLAALAVLALAGCDDGKGPMQTAGEKTDNAAKTTGHAVKGAAETTGDAVKTGVEKTGDALETAGDAVKNTVD
jgi:predicted small lipoprotein YifL